MTSFENRLPTGIREAVSVLRRHWRWAAASAAIGAAFGLTYAAVRTPVWSSTQAAVLRNEAIGELTRQGRFESADALKAAQETVLQVAKHPETLAAALRDVGPPKSFFQPAEFPGDGDVEAFADCVSVSAPKGLEFGKSEVMYLSVESENALRATALVEALCERVDLHLRELRRERAGEIIAEMERTVALSREELRQATEKLLVVERNVGSDLGELRVLNESGGGESNLRTSLNQIRAEIRQAEADLTGKEELRRILEAARSDPSEFLATPNRLLESQPALRRLKDGVVDAQLRRAALVGKLNPNHPEVLAAVASEKEAQQNLFRELEGAARGNEADTRVVEASLKNLRRQFDDVESRLASLAGMRAEYGNLVAVVRQRNEALQAVEKQLSDARASLEAADTARLLSKMGPPVPSDGPIGPGKFQLVLGGAMLGALGCVGIVILISPLTRPRGRRAADFLPAHLRPAERNTGRRSQDRNADPTLMAVAAIPPTEAPPTVRIQTSSSAERGRRATDVAEPYRGPDRRDGDRRANSPVEEPTERTDANAGEVRRESSIADCEPAAGIRDADDESSDGETRQTSALLDNLRKQIEMLRESGTTPIDCDSHASPSHDRHDSRS